MVAKRHIQPFDYFCYNSTLIKAGVGSYEGERFVLWKGKKMNTLV